MTHEWRFPWELYINGPPFTSGKLQVFFFSHFHEFPNFYQNVLFYLVIFAARLDLLSCSRLSTFEVERADLSTTFWCKTLPKEKTSKPPHRCATTLRPHIIYLACFPSLFSTPSLAKHLKWRYFWATKPWIICKTYPRNVRWEGICQILRRRSFLLCYGKWQLELRVLRRPLNQGPLVLTETWTEIINHY